MADYSRKLNCIYLLENFKSYEVQFSRFSFTIYLRPVENYFTRRKLYLCNFCITTVFVQFKLYPLIYFLSGSQIVYITSISGLFYGMPIFFIWYILVALEGKVPRLKLATELHLMSRIYEPVPPCVLLLQRMVPMFRCDFIFIH
jgi:hypothetical protein